MGNEPLVSVIVAAFNVQYYIAETLDSILAQTYPHVEIIVVDDGSTDQTAEIIQSYGAKVLIIQQPNSGGAAVPRNTGIERSSGEYLCFLDADDIMTEDRIAVQVDFLERHPEVGLVFSDYKNFTVRGHLSRSHFETCPLIWSKLQNRNELVVERARPLLLLENFGIAGSFMFRRALLALEGGFEPSLKACEDFHFYFRLAQHTRVGVINTMGMLRRLHEHNVSANLFKMYSEGIRSRILLLNGEEERSIREQLAKYIASRQRALARLYADSGSYRQSFLHDWQVLAGPFFWSEAKSAFRNIGRTLLLALGITGRGKEKVVRKKQG